MCSINIGLARLAYAAAQSTTALSWPLLYSMRFVPLYFALTFNYIPFTTGIYVNVWKHCMSIICLDISSIRFYI